LQTLELQGYVIMAVNTDSTDYVACARRLSLSLKHHHPDAKVCLVTDQEIEDHAFDHVRLIVPDVGNPYANDAQLFRLSPFRETVKLEADMLIASPIDHWWSMFRHRDVVLSQGCRNWQDQVSTARQYRRLFDDNHLPDVYNAITYWRLSNTAKEFFDLVKKMFGNWDQYRTLIKFSPDRPDTDLVYAMAAQIMGADRVTVPGSPQIVHMKRHHAGTQTENWTQELVWETDPLRIQTVAQWGAFHYCVKDWQP
jgi:hypothetical protein